MRRAMAVNNRKHGCGLFSENFRDLRMIGLTATVLYVIYEIIMVMGIEISNINDGHDFASLSAKDFFTPFFILVLLIAPMMMVVSFRYMSKRNMSDFIFALPYKRVTMFFLRTAAVFTWTIIILCSSFLTAFVCSELCSHVEIDILGCLAALGKILVSVLLVVGGFSLGITITGTFLTNIATSLIIIFVPRLLLIMLVSIVESATPFAPLGEVITRVLSESNVIFQMFSDDDEMIVSIVGIVPTIVEALVYICAATFIYNVRPAETAGRTEIHPAVGVSTRLLLASIPAAAAAGCFTDASEALGIFMFILAIAVYVVYELMTTKRIKSLVKHLKFMAAIPVFSVLVFLVCNGIANKVNSYRPDIGRLEYAIVRELPYVLNGVIISNDKVIDRDNLELLTKGCVTPDDSFPVESFQLTVDFFEDGHKYTRYVYVGENTLVQILPELFAGKVEFKYDNLSAELHNIYLYELTEDETVVLGETFLNEISQDYSLLLDCAIDDDWSKNVAGVYLRVKGQSYYNSSFGVSLKCRDTVAKMKELLSEQPYVVPLKELGTENVVWWIWLLSGDTLYCQTSGSDTEGLLSVLENYDGNGDAYADTVMLVMATNNTDRICIDIFNPTEDELEAIKRLGVVFYE